MPTEHMNLSPLLAFVSSVRAIDSQLPAQCLHVLLAVASKAGITYREIERATGIAGASVSRNIHALGTAHRNGKPGYGLVAQVPGRLDTRASEVFLTAKGRATVRTLLEAVTGEPAEGFSPPTVR